ncbi:DEAD/DEAH box helicase [Ureibacillus sinduriensis]|uniref:DNA helicase n=1 Tax=Ureibacillus sinduriensis BLB-1 = JCM 15800 TaxID=1384057 RepID=A0A0A3HQL5_9BACL|nr:AAA domain-containing protein [Ureibacillus sinduriensis]KGR74861.1 DNA helicase [Ureibacillus sinduriensis BLB-1 = JCM 15800]
MVQKMETIETVKCFIVLTNTAREAIKQHFQDEHSFFKLQNPFEVYIEKQSVEETSLSLTIFFDNERNENLKQKFGDRVVIMDCAFDLKNGLVAKSFRTRGKNTPIATNRRQRMRIRLVPSRINGHTYPKEFISTLAQLPIAQERFDFVNKRISSWEGYLKVQYKNASIDDIDATFNSIQYSADFSKVSLRCNGIDEKQWKQLKGLSAYVKGFPREIGEVVKANKQERSIQIELNPRVAKLARTNDFDFTSEYITFSNASTKSQLNRLLKGFERLKEGLAANPNLENILFEDTPKISERKNEIGLDFHNNLNEYQRAAVAGAVSADDLYVIQGPPGTGKTTVISEICYQNAKAGLKTLIASQSNLAVDNALSRLLSNKDIRILRYGRTESIEEEGKKFIEENVSEYWKEQTYEAIKKEIEGHKTKEIRLKEEILNCENEIGELKEKETKLLEGIEIKATAKEKLAIVSEKISQLKKQIVPLKKEREKTEETLEKLVESGNKISVRINEIKQSLETIGTATTIDEEIQKAKSNIEKSRRMIDYIHVKSELDKIESQLDEIKTERKTFENRSSMMDSSIQEVQALKKVHEIVSFIEKNQVRRGYVLNRLFSDMEKIHEQLIGFKSLNEISTRLDKAIDYSQSILGIQVQTPELPANHHYSLQEIDEFLTRLSHAFAQKKINKENGVRSIQGLYLRKLALAQIAYRYRALIEESLLIFGKIKEEIIDQMMQQGGIDQASMNSFKTKEETLNSRLVHCKTQLQSFDFSLLEVESMPSITEIQTVLDVLEKEIVELEQNKEKIDVLKSQLSRKTDELESVQEQVSNGEVVLKETIAQLKELNLTGIQLEKESEQLEQLTKQNPELELEKTKERMNYKTQEIERLHKKIEMLPVAQNMQIQWKALLEQATEHDLEEIRKLYVKHANVIGTTCVASANKEFMENYPVFDVVIIDEVSKATPPELLLPMLKGKKVVLVGDHHQLPPLIGDDTFEETLETVIKESNTFEEKRELEKLLEESLFERLYKNLPASNKKMLAIQYRMHENIMKTISPFYEHGNDSLQCGLPDSDAIRDHKLESAFVKRNDHLLWVDIPNKQEFFEERMKEGSSLLNESEIEVIRKMLIDFNEATANAKAKGLMPEDELKSIGVISFYAAQVKRINRLIEQELNLPHLHIRTGSVDKFQGMEMDVILVSMVRNNDNKHGDIGFAKDYRRLNVALSRARELLVLIGSTEMFVNRPKKEETRKMYKTLLNTVKSQNGYQNKIESYIS